MSSRTISHRCPRGWPVKSICLAVLVICGKAALAQGQTQAQGQPLVPGVAAGTVIIPPPPQAWRVERYLRTTVTATDNSGLSTAAQVPKDVVIDIEPRLVVRGRGASFNLNADVATHFLIYADDSQDSRILPVGTVALNANLVDRWLYLDTSVSADQISADPYAFRTDIDTGRNRINTLGYRLSPYLKHDFTPSLSLLARSDNYWTKRRGEFSATDARRNSLFEKQSVLLEKRPLPLGFSAEASQETTSYRSGDRETVLKIDSARGVVTYAVDPTFVIGLVGGTEKSVFSLTTTTDQIAGGRFSWAPTERTELKGSYEQRFFGNGGSLQWTHRSPFIGLTVSAAREPTATGSSFVLAANSGSVQSLLDAIFTTRYPDPSQRAVVVNGVIAGLGIPNVLGEPLEVFSNYAQLRDSFNTAIIFQGVRSTVITRLFAVRLQQLNLADVPAVAGVGITADNTQKGISVDYNRRMTAAFTANLSVGYSEIEGLGLAAGLFTTNRNIRLTLGQDLSPDTKVSYGLRYQVDHLTTPTDDRRAKETAAFIGVIHRF